MKRLLLAACTASLFSFATTTFAATNSAPTSSPVVDSASISGPNSSFKDECDDREGFAAGVEFGLSKVQNSEFKLDGETSRKEFNELKDKKVEFGYFGKNIGLDLGYRFKLNEMMSLDAGVLGSLYFLESKEVNPSTEMKKEDKNATYDELDSAVKDFNEGYLSKLNQLKTSLETAKNAEKKDEKYIAETEKQIKDVESKLPLSSKSFKDIIMESTGLKVRKYSIEESMATLMPRLYVNVVQLDNLSIFAGGGIGISRSKTTLTSTSHISEDEREGIKKKDDDNKKKGNDPFKSEAKVYKTDAKYNFAYMLSFGAKYDITSNLAARLRYEFLSPGKREISFTNDDDKKVSLTSSRYIHSIKAGLVFKF